MLNRLPREAPSFAELVRDIGSPKPAALAKALDVSERTIHRWMRGKAPRAARLSLWWLSFEGHSTWDAEMANRTALALATNDSLWRAVGELRRKVDGLEDTNSSALCLDISPRRSGER